MGREPADMVITDGTWVNVYSGEIIPDTDIAIKHGRIAYVGPDAAHAAHDETRVIDAKGRYMVPGLCDAHMHVESGMVTVTEFARAVIPHGTTSMFIDPHEIANVLGLEGVKLMHDEAMTLPINVFVQMPSCVPSAPGLEHAGAELGVDDIREAMGWPNIIGLGEMMNFPGIFNADAQMIGEVAATMEAGKTVGGHYASPDLGLPFHAYAAGGPADDHEGTRAEDAIASEGHMNRVLRHAIAQGLNPVTAIQMCTLNTAQHFGVERDLGSIAPGRRADIILTSDLATFPVETVIARGEILSEQSFDIFADQEQVRARVIGVVENQAPTKALEANLNTRDDIVQMDRENDVAQIALVERHRATGAVQNAFVKGFGYNTDCAMASTVAHDSHHMIVVGTNKEDMAKAANRLKDVGGGITLFAGGEEKALVELPIAGLMSSERSDIVAAKADTLMQAMKACGCTLNNAYMQHSLLALVVIPELRISDLGLVDVTKFEVTELFVE